MKKIIPFFLLAVSTSFSFLIAQDNNQIKDYWAQGIGLKSSDSNTDLNCHLNMGSGMNGTKLRGFWDDFRVRKLECFQGFLE